ncbi:MAG: nucleotidyltransferase domain-containing protein [Oscillospiraceae bacterium]|nr:nucleotidyltransferase domain-containing protein [Oscillospiraceae bacterium]
MNKAHSTEINEIVNCILSSVPVSEIYLFGSFAKGIEKDDSDYDFYVVVPDDIGMREIEARWEIGYSLIGKRPRSVDMFVGKQSKFNRRKEYFYSIENEVAETGVKLYG